MSTSLFLLNCWNKSLFHSLDKIKVSTKSDELFLTPPWRRWWRGTAVQPSGGIPLIHISCPKKPPKTSMYVVIFRNIFQVLKQMSLKPGAGSPYNKNKPHCRPEEDTHRQTQPPIIHLLRGSTMLASNLPPTITNISQHNTVAMNT